MTTISNTHSYFWRHPDQFQELESILLLKKSQQPISVWCAGCAQGEEVYTVALLMDRLGVKGSILGTDILPTAIKAAQAGRYHRRKIEQLPPFLKRKLKSESAEMFSIPSSLQEAIRFQNDDLLNSRISGQFDLILCRNVMIYFSSAEIEIALNALHQRLSPTGILILGYAESSMLTHPQLRRINIHGMFEIEPKKTAAPMSLAPLTDTNFHDALKAYAMGETKTANTLFEDNLERRPDSRVGLYFKALLDEELGRRLSAREALKKIVASQSTDDSQTDVYLKRHGLSPQIFEASVKRALLRLGESHA